MDLTLVRRAVARMKTALFKNANSYSIGMLKSHFRGSGLQFKEHQVYNYGDDVRFIDWKIYAKMNTPYIKTFDEERCVEIVVLIDVSATMFSGFEGVSKLQAAIELCSLLYLLAKETGDFVHALVVSDEVIHVPKKNGEEGVAHLLAVLERKRILDENGNVNLQYVPRPSRKDEEKVTAIMKHLAKNREIVILSDFNEFIEVELIKKLLYRRNVHCFQLQSPLDEANRIPYALYTKANPFTRSGRLQRVKLGGKEFLQNPFGKKFRRLKVHERYLEEFIKEML